MPADRIALESDLRRGLSYWAARVTFAALALTAFAALLDWVWS